MADVFATADVSMYLCRTSQGPRCRAGKRGHWTTGRFVNPWTTGRFVNPRMTGRFVNPWMTGRFVNPLHPVVTDKDRSVYSADKQADILKQNTSFTFTFYNCILPMGFLL